MAVATRGWRRPDRLEPNAAVYALRPCVRIMVRDAVSAMVPLLTVLLKSFVPASTDLYLYRLLLTCTGLAAAGD